MKYTHFTSPKENDKEHMKNLPFKDKHQLINRATEFTIQNNTIKRCQQRMEVKNGIKNVYTGNNRMITTIHFD